MTKSIYIVAICAASVLAIITLYLAWLNRSPKIYGPLVSILLGAVTATFITLVTLLKPTKIQIQFPVSISLDANTKLAVILPITYTSALSTQLRQSRSEEIEGKLNHFQQRTVKLNSPEEENQFYSDVIQLALVKQLYAVVTFKTGISVASFAKQKPMVRAVTTADLKPKHFHELDGREIPPLLTKNRFMDRTEREFWENQNVRLSLPVGAEISFAENQMILERPNYYQIRFSIKPVGSGNGYPPHLLDVIKETSVTTIIYVIECEADFDRFTAESPAAVEVKEWTQNLFSEFQKQIGDPVN